MLKASEMYEKSKESVKNNDATILEKIEIAIEAAAERGEFCVWFRPEKNISYNSGAIEVLRNRGFKVKTHDKDIDDYGNIYPLILEISWDNKEETNWKTRLKKLFHIL